MSDHPQTPQEDTKTDEQIILDGIAQNRDVMLAMLRQARREVLLCSLVLEPQLLNNHEAINILRGIVANRKNFMLRAIVYEPALLTSTGHRLLDFGRSKPSFFQFRIPAPQHASFEQALFIMDGIAFIHRPRHDSWRGIANFGDERKAQHYKGVFEEIWSHGESSQELRQFRM